MDVCPPEGRLEAFFESFVADRRSAAGTRPGAVLPDEHTGCTKCKEGTGVRQADLDIDRKFVELNFCTDVFKRFTAHIETMQDIAAENAAAQFKKVEYNNANN